MNKKLAAAFVMIAAAMWGTTGPFVRVISEYGLSSMQIVEARNFCGAISYVLFLLIFNRKLLKVNWKDLWIFAGAGLLFVNGSGFFYFKAVEIMDLSTAAILLYTSPMFVMIASLFLFKEKITYNKVIALVLAFGGCILVSGLGNGNVSTLGVIYGLLSAVGYATYSIFSRIALKRGYHPVTVSTYIIVMAFLWGLLLTDIPSLLQVLDGQAGKVMGTVYLSSLVITLIPYVMYAQGLKHLETSKAAIMTYMEPASATFLGLVLYHEPLTLTLLAGFLLVGLALYILNKPAKEKRAE